MKSYIENGRLEIKRSKSESVKLMLISALFAVMGIFLAFSPKELIGCIRFADTTLGEIIIRGLLLISGIVFVIAFVFFLKNIRREDPLITADEYGITDSSTAGSSEILIPWKNIKNIYLYNMRVMSATQKFIGIELFDTEGYLDELRGFRRKNAEANMKLGYPAVNLTLAGTKEKPEDVLPGLISLWEKYR